LREGVASARVCELGEGGRKQVSVFFPNVFQALGDGGIVLEGRGYEVEPTLVLIDNVPPAAHVSGDLRLSGLGRRPPEPAELEVVGLDAVLRNVIEACRYQDEVPVCGAAAELRAGKDGVAIGSPRLSGLGVVPDFCGVLVQSGRLALR